MAYEFVEENEVRRYRNDCSEVLKETVQILGKKGISAQFVLVGSGARNMVTRNGNGPFDLDYNLVIIKALAEYWNDLRLLKETVRNALNKAMGADFFSNAHDSTSCLNVILHFTDTPDVEFSFDVAILTRNEDGNLMRLIKNKNAWGIRYDQYTWNEVPSSKDVRRKASVLKEKNLWNEVRDTYLDKKNRYLSRRDNDHPSFIVYVEAVNEIYDEYY